MRPIGVVIVGFFYLLSAGYYLADTVILTPAGIDVDNLRGEDFDARGTFENISGNSTAVFDRATARSAGGADTFDRVLGFSYDGFEAVWTMFTLLTGNYHFVVLGMLGVHPALIGVLQAIMALIVVRTLIYYILGR